MDVQNAAGVHVHAVATVFGGEQDGDEGGVPVVGDEHALLSVCVAPEGEHQGRLAGGVAEEREAELVVAEGAPGVAVRCSLPVVGRVVHKYPVHTCTKLVEEGDFVCATKAADGDAALAIEGALVEGVRHAVHVSRGDDHDAVAALREGDGEGAAHVAQAAGLGVGRHFGRHKDDVEERLGSLGLVRVRKILQHLLLHFVPFGRVGGECERVLRRGLSGCHRLHCAAAHPIAAGLHRRCILASGQVR